MMTSTECLAKAVELDGVAAKCLNEESRVAFAQTAMSWRATARIAQFQENWEAAQADADYRS